jgi:DNA-binding transcriptional LysR family regulator
MQLMAVDSRLFSGLSAFAAVLEAGSFVRAGEALGLTQSAVSRSVQRLEERLGVRLFERSSKVIRLTEDGERFCAVGRGGRRNGNRFRQSERAAPD